MMAGGRAPGAKVANVSEHVSPTDRPLTLQGRLDLAQRLYREFHTRCFWHCRPDLEITEELLPFVAQGLRANGGHRGFKLAALL